MLLQEFIFSIVSGLVSSTVIVVSFYFWDKSRWAKVKRVFLSKMSGQRFLANYQILTILQIDITSGHRDGARSDDEICAEILHSSITPKQYEALYKYFKILIEDFEKFRAQALNIPTFTPEDFFSLDEETRPLRSYLSSYSLLAPIDENDDEGEDIDKILKKNLISIYKVFERKKSKKLKGLITQVEV